MISLDDAKTTNSPRQWRLLPSRTIFFHSAFLHEFAARGKQFSIIGEFVFALSDRSVPVIGRITAALRQGAIDCEFVILDYAATADIDGSWRIIGGIKLRGNSAGFVVCDGIVEDIQIAFSYDKLNAAFFVGLYHVAFQCAFHALSDIDSFLGII